MITDITNEIKSQRFENYYVADHNRFAAAAACAVAQEPGLYYNPLLIFAGKGLGKTHLLHAIGNAVSEEDSDAQVRYVEGHVMVTDIAKAIEGDTVVAYLESFVTTDCLLVDDVECIAGKEPEQVIFCRLLQQMVDHNKQVVFSCGWHPERVTGFPDKLRSRFTAGLTVDIMRPGMKGRVKMLRKLAKEHGIPVRREVFWVVAAAIKDNIGEMIRVFIAIINAAAAQGKVVNLNMAVRFLEEKEKDKGSM